MQHTKPQIASKKNQYGNKKPAKNVTVGVTSGNARSQPLKEVAPVAKKTGGKNIPILELLDKMRQTKL